MQILELFVDGQPAPLKPGPRLDQSEVLVPVHAFSGAVGAEAKFLDGSRQLAVCKGDLCVPVLADISIDGEAYAPLPDLAEPLGFSWVVEGEVLRVSTGREALSGLGIGSHPPEFTLPDLHTGEMVSLRQYRGKKAVFYMWASW